MINFFNNLCSVYKLLLFRISILWVNKFKSRLFVKPFTQSFMHAHCSHQASQLGLLLFFFFFIRFIIITISIAIWVCYRIRHFNIELLSLQAYSRRWRFYFFSNCIDNFSYCFYLLWFCLRTKTIRLSCKFFFVFFVIQINRIERLWLFILVVLLWSHFIILLFYYYKIEI